MTVFDYSHTREYRDELAGALDVARQRLPARDFRDLAKGVEQEIARLDKELGGYYDVLFPRCASLRCASESWSAWELVSARVIPSGITAPIFSIRFNSPNRPFAPWIGHSERINFLLPSGCSFANAF